MERHDVIVIGGGQAALSVGYFLRRTRRSFLLLDAESGAGGAWRHGWRSLRLFSPATWSSLAGWPMPAGDDRYRGREAVVDYLGRYEQRYALPVRRPVRVDAVERADDGLVVRAAREAWHARAVVSATGNWRHPWFPPYPGRDAFRGGQLHSAQYVNAESFAGGRVLVVGGGVLFQRATERWRAQQEGRPADALPGGFGDIVMVPPVLEARSRGVLVARGPFEKLLPQGVRWRDGTETWIDAVIWCTGFRPALTHLASLGIIGATADGNGSATWRVAVDGTRSLAEPRLWLVGYGDWSGMASATLVGVMRTARSTVQEIDACLGTDPSDG